MKRNIVAWLAAAALFAGLAGGSQVHAAAAYTQDHLSGKWKLSVVVGGKTQAGSAAFSKTGKLTKWVLIGVTQGADSGRLSVADDGKVTGVLKRSRADSRRGVTYHFAYAFNLQFISPAKVTGSVLLTLTERNNSTGNRTGTVQRIPAQWTMTRLLRIQVRRPK